MNTLVTVYLPVRFRNGRIKWFLKKKEMTAVPPAGTNIEIYRYDHAGMGKEVLISCVPIKNVFVDREGHVTIELQTLDWNTSDLNGLMRYFKSAPEEHRWKKSAYYHYFQIKGVLA